MIQTTVCRQILKDLKICIIVPTYNNCRTIEQLLAALLPYTDDLIIVNDGSSDETKNILNKFNQLNIISYPENKGKGYALRQGFSKAIESGFDYAITIDSDGQHSPDDIPAFIETIQSYPGSLIIGSRNMDQDGIPGKSTFGHRFSNFWFYAETTVKLPDTQSGYRLYPLKALQNMKFFTGKFEFEIEVLVRLSWKGINILSVPVSVYYPLKNDRISHFRPVHDFLRISALNTILVFAAVLFMLPLKFIKKLNKQNIEDFFKNNFIYTKDSDLKITLSVMFGIFMSVIPIWGWQFITAIVLAHFFRLNKVIVGITSNQSVPPLIPVILYLSYFTGGLVLGKHNQHIYGISTINMEFVKQNLIQYIIGSAVFGTAMSLLTGLITFIMLKIFRKKIIDMKDNKQNIINDKLFHKSF